MQNIYRVKVKTFKIKKNPNIYVSYLIVMHINKIVIVEHRDGTEVYAYLFSCRVRITVAIKVIFVFNRIS